jgi:hypothetical protein
VRNPGSFFAVALEASSRCSVTEEIVDCTEFVVNVLGQDRVSLIVSSFVNL